MRQSFESFIATTLAYQELPEKLEEEELSQLTARLREGDYDVVNPIINGHMRLTMAIVSERATRRWVDDLIGVGLLTLTRTVHREAGPKGRLQDNNITPFLANIIRRRLRDFLATTPVVRIKARTLNRITQKGEKVELPAEPIPISENHILLFPYSMPAAKRSEVEPEVSEILRLAIRSDTERQIITLRAQGYNDREISPMIGISPVRVGQLRARVEQRYDALSG